MEKLPGRMEAEVIGREHNVRMTNEQIVIMMMNEKGKSRSGWKNGDSAYPNTIMKTNVNNASGTDRGTVRADECDELFIR